MPPAVKIRPEAPTDESAISEVIRLAFAGKSFASGTESDVVLKLRECGDLTLSLVAVLDGVVIGHVAFSEAPSGDGSQTWHALGPVAVLPEYQKSGVGSALINEGLDWLAGHGSAGCILLGDYNYYKRFGFVLSPENCPDGLPAEHFMIKSISGQTPVGKFSFHAAFDD